MKKPVFCLLLIGVSLQAFSQSTVPALPATSEEYLQKSKDQKSGAWLLMGFGVVFSSIGAITAIPKAADDIGYGIQLLPNIITGNNQPPPKTNYTAQTILLIGGLACIASSIPLYIAAARNKNTALILSFKNEQAPHLQKNSFTFSPLPSLSLKLSL